MKRDEISEMLRQIMVENSEVCGILNKNARRRLLQPGNTRGLFRVIRLYLFSKEKGGRGTIRRFCHLMASVAKGNWMELELLYAYYLDGAVSGDMPETRAVFSGK